MTESNWSERFEEMRYELSRIEEHTDADHMSVRTREDKTTVTLIYETEQLLLGVASFKLQQPLYVSEGSVFRCQQLNWCRMQVQILLGTSMKKYSVDVWGIRNGHQNYVIETESKEEAKKQAKILSPFTMVLNIEVREVDQCSRNYKSYLCQLKKQVVIVAVRIKFAALNVIL